MNEFKIKSEIREFREVSEIGQQQAAANEFVDDGWGHDTPEEATRAERRSLAAKNLSVMRPVAHMEDADDGWGHDAPEEKAITLEQAEPTAQRSLDYSADWDHAEVVSGEVLPPLDK